MAKSFEEIKIEHYYSSLSTLRGQKMSAENYESKGDYVDAKRYYFEAAKGYKELIQIVKEIMHEGGGALWRKKLEEHEMDYEYCMMQVSAMNSIRYGQGL